MKTPIIYGIPNCDTMKKAFTALDEARISYQFHNYKKDGIDAAKINEWLRQLGTETLVNKKGTTWRKLSSEEQASLNNSTNLINWLVSNPSAIKRPLVEQNGKLAVGLDELKALLIS